MRFYTAVLPLAVLFTLPGSIAAQSYHPRHPVTLPVGTPIAVRLNYPLSTEHDRAGTRFSATLAEPIRVDGHFEIPRGTQCHGTVVKSERSGHLKGKADMALRLDSIDAYGRSQTVVTIASNFRGKGKKGHNLKWIGGGTAGGTIIGALAGGGTGALIGAGVGAAGGTAGAAASSKRDLTLAAETPLTFTLAQPWILH